MMAPSTDSVQADDTVVRLLDAMATSVDERGPKATTVADVVRIARTSRPAITLAWILDTPGLGTAARAQRESMAEFYTLIGELLDSPTYNAEHPQAVSRFLPIILVGGLRELLAIHVEDNGDVSDIEEIVDAATESTIAVLSVSVD